jgi:hypothetical protein
MRRKTVLLALCVAAGAIAVSEMALREINYRQNATAWTGSTILFYTDRLFRWPNSDLSFRLYGPNATLLASADWHLNNLGFFSRRDYAYGRGPNEIRIVVLGGEQTASSVTNVSWPDLLEDALNRRESAKTYKVFNVAWPDAGPAHYLEYWEQEGRHFDPDLVIVNVVETDFYRGLPSSPLRYRGQPTVLSPIAYRVGDGPDDIASTMVSHTQGASVASFRDPLAVPSRPYGFFASRAFMDDRDKVRRLQSIIVDDMIAGATDGGLLVRAFRGKSPLFSVWEERWFDPLPSSPLDKTEMVETVARAFKNLMREMPRVLFTHNFNAAERDAKFELTEALLTRYPEIRLVDMRRNIPPGTSPATFNSWFLFPHMSEKWSDEGHRVYAEMMAAEVLLVLRQAGDQPTGAGAPANRP